MSDSWSQFPLSGAGRAVVDRHPRRPRRNLDL